MTWESHRSKSTQYLGERAFFAAQGVQDIRLLEALAEKMESAPKTSTGKKEAANLLREIRQQVRESPVEFNQNRMTLRWPYPNLRDAIEEAFLGLEAP